jgi:hypothetical protein
MADGDHHIRLGHYASVGWGADLVSIQLAEVADFALIQRSRRCLSVRLTKTRAVPAIENT